MMLKYMFSQAQWPAFLKQLHPDLQQGHVETADGPIEARVFYANIAERFTDFLATHRESIFPAEIPGLLGHWLTQLPISREELETRLAIPEPEPASLLLLPDLAAWEHQLSAELRQRFVFEKR